MDIQERQKRVHEIRTMREDGVKWGDIAKHFGYSCADTARHNYRKMNGRLARHLEERGIDPADVTRVWDKTKEYSVCTVYDKPYTQAPQEYMKQFQDALKFDFGVEYKLKKPQKPRGDLLIINPADLHIGKLASYDSGKYNIAIALERAREGVRGILDSTSGYEIKQIVFVIGNDIIHFDNKSGTTTKGTRQDTDGMWWDAYKAASRLYVECIEWMKEVAPVHVIHCRSNHDEILGQTIAWQIEAYYAKEKNITFDVSVEPYKYYKWGNTGMGFGHQEPKASKKGGVDLPMTMALECPFWSEVKYRIWYIGHLHHAQEKEIIPLKDTRGVTIRNTRSASISDDWHKVSGYISPVLAVEGFVISEKHGECGAFSHNF